LETFGYDQCRYNSRLHLWQFIHSHRSASSTLPLLQWVRKQFISEFTLLLSISGVSKRWYSAKKYERFLYQTKTWIALRKVIEKWAKKRFWKKSKMSPLLPHQKSQFLPLNLEIYLRTVKLPYLTENLILNNFDFHGWLSESDIIWVMAVANSRISARVLGNRRNRDLTIPKQCKFRNLKPP